MKKLLLSLLTAVVSFAVSAEEQSITATFTKDNWTGVSAYDKTITSKDSLWTTVNFNNNNFNTWTYIKCGRKNNASVGSILTNISRPEKIKEVVVTIDAATNTSVNFAALYISADKNNWGDPYKKVTNVSQGDLTFTIDNPQADLFYKVDFDCKSASSNGVVTVSKFTLIYDEEAEVDPNLEPAGLSYETTEFTVVADETFSAPTLSNPNGIEPIEYTSSNSTVATVDASTGAVTLTGVAGTTTIKASFAGNDTYAAGSASYTLTVTPAPYHTLKEFIQHETKEEITAIGNFGVIYQNGDYLLVTDGTSNALIYQNKNVYAVGTAISEITGTVEFYGQLFELKNATLTEGGEGATYTPSEITTASEVSIANNLFDEVIIKGNLSGVNGKNATLTLANGTTLALYNTFNITEGFENAENVTVTGFVWRYNNNLQIAPISIEAEEGEKICATPTFSATEIYAGESITITSTPGCNIMYEVTGAASFSGEGTSPLTTKIFEVPGTYEIYVLAYADGYTESDVTATITVTEKPLAETLSFIGKHENAEEIKSATAGIVSFAFEKGFNSNTPKYYTTGTAMRIYGGNEMTISVPNGYAITNIEFTTDKDNSKFNNETTATVGTLNGLTWTAGNDIANKVIITNGGTSGHIRIQTITVKYTIVPLSPEVLVNGEALDGTEVDLGGGSAELTITAADGHHIYHKHEPAVAAAAYYFDGEEADDEHAGFTHVSQNVATVTVDKNGTLTYYAHNPETNQKSVPVSLNFVNDVTTSLSEIESAAKIEYFDMQGRRVAAPANGIFIRREGSRAAKVRL